MPSTARHCRPTSGGSYSPPRSLFEVGRGLMEGEVGCALSHLRLLQRMLDERLPEVMIVEDDVAPKPAYAGCSSGGSTATRRPRCRHLLLAAGTRRPPSAGPGVELDDEHRFAPTGACSSARSATSSPRTPRGGCGRGVSDPHAVRRAPVPAPARAPPRVRRRTAAVMLTRSTRSSSRGRRHPPAGHEGSNSLRGRLAVAGKVHRGCSAP